jgi:hypothetical protein
MEKITLELPQLVLTTKPGFNGKYLEKFAEESGKPKANLTFQEDLNDSRIIAIKYKLSEKETESNIFYYSESFNKCAIVTFNLGYNYQGRVLVRDYENHKMGFNLEHLSKDGLRKKHIEKINHLNDIKNNLTPEYVARRYSNLFYNLPKFI